jgi:hypothetical protein
MENPNSGQARNGVAARIHVAGALARRARAFIYARPRLQAWLADALSRFPAVKQRVKAFLLRTDASAPTHVGSTHRHGNDSVDRLPRRAASVLRDLDRERARLQAPH